MKVIKRNGKEEDVKLDKVTKRVDKLSYNLKVEPIKVAQKVIAGIYDGITSKQIDELLSETAALLSADHPDYSKLASRIGVSSLHKETRGFYYTMKELYKAEAVSDEFVELVRKYGKQLEKNIDYDRDLEFEYFGFKTLERSYLLKIDGKIVERPQHMYMRVALAICKDNLEDVVALYDDLSLKRYTHATPTLFNAGTRLQQLSSCFLIQMEDDSIEGIFNTAKDCAKISKNAGGIGLHVHNIRAKGSHIKGTNGTSNGIVPMLQVFNNIARYVDQCFDPETDIYTKEGIKKIKDVVIGDEVITSSGTTERVKKVFRRNNMNERIAYSLKLKHSIKPVTVTGAHPLLTLRGQKKMTNYSTIANRLSKKLVEPEYISVEELQEDDMIAFSIPSYVRDHEEYTLDDCRFYGAMLGDGFLSKSGKQSYICGNPNKDDFNFYSNYLYSNGIQYTDTKRDDNYRRLVFSPHQSESLFKFDRVHFYDSNGEKRVHPSMLHLPLDKTKQILKGLLQSDAFIGEDTEGTEVVFEITSENLAESLRYMLLRLGILTSGDIRNRVGEAHNTKRGIIENKKLIYRLRIPKTEEICEILELENKSKFLTQFRHENLIFTRLQNIDKLNYYQGLVYDLELEGPNHDYLTHCGVAHNGGGKRKGSFAIYLEPWHADIEEFLTLKKPTGKDEFRARDLFYALWTPDLFMERVEKDEMWTLMCPHECPGLSDVHSGDFKKLYEKYEKEGKGKKQIKARELWMKVLEAQTETGTPYVLYKDAANSKSNQKNLGTIKSSNLCCEIMEYTDSEESAVCNLASVCLNAFVEEHVNGKTTLKYNFKKLHETVKRITKNLNRVIDLNYYPTDKTKVSNQKHRPIGIGVQGLADVFFLMGIPYDSDEAKKLNKEIFETIYHAAVETSMEIASEEGPYETFNGSPASKGILQFDMWDVTPGDRYDWKDLKSKVKKNGLRNSLLLAPMPTASTASIYGNHEAFEAQTSNLYKRQVLAGEFIMVNKYLVKELEKINLWNEDIRDKIIEENGSVQNIPEIPTHIKEIYKTVWEISQKVIIDMSADRGAFICQSQSLNLWLANPNFGNLNSMHFYAWKKGLKTGMYYLRSKPAVQAQKVTTKMETKQESSAYTNEEALVCSLENPEDCVACGS